MAESSRSATPISRPASLMCSLEPLHLATTLIRLNQILRGIEEDETDVFIINFAGPDMVGHTGKLDKMIEACQYVDTCLGWITKGIRHTRGVTIITADHGNAEQMIDPKSGGPHTAHTLNPVPFHLIDEASRGLKLREGGALEDVEVSADLIDYVVALVRATRDHRQIQVGASPRGSLAVMKLARAHAALAGRGIVL